MQPPVRTRVTGKRLASSQPALSSWTLHVLDPDRTIEIASYPTHRIESLHPSPAKARLDAQDPLGQAEHGQRLAAKALTDTTRTTRAGGRPLKPKRPEVRAQVNLTGPDNRAMVLYPCL